MSWYGTQIKKPQWQKKRLEILSRDEWKCTLCGDSEEELHVHHKAYKGLPWEAETEDLTTLCKQCHSASEYLPEHKFFEAKKVNKYLYLYNSEQATFLITFETHSPRLHGIFLKDGILLNKIVEFNKRINLK